MIDAARIAELVRGGEVHRDVCTSAAVFDHEMTQLFAATWVRHTDKTIHALHKRIDRVNPDTTFADIQAFM